MANEIDRFAGIAGRDEVYRNGSLVTPEPAPRPDRVLPLSSGEKPGLFPVHQTMETAAELEEALATMRSAYSRFLEDHSPELPIRRQQRSLEHFQWRMETPEDRRDFDRVRRGEGEWNDIVLPHYGGPIGRFTSLYRTVLPKEWIPEEILRTWICFGGADYSAEVYVNGAYVGGHTGFFAPFSMDMTDFCRPSENILVIRLANDYTTLGSVGDNSDSEGRKIYGDKIFAATGPGWDDPEQGWHHCPPGMGLYQNVHLEWRPPMFISDVYVRPIAETDEAEAWIEVTQSDLKARRLRFQFNLYGQNFKHTVFENLLHDPGTTRTVGLGDSLTESRLRAAGRLNESMPAVTMPGPQVIKFRFSVPDMKSWEPSTPWLYQLQVGLLDDDDQIVDSASRQFGMRSFAIEEDSEPRGRIVLNGREIRLRGANTMGHLQQCVIKGDTDQLIDDILLAKLANMNFLRLTQRPVQEDIYEYCDRLGLMTQTDLPLFGALGRHLFHEAVRQAAEMERLVRSHPSNVLVSFINEPFPNGDNCPHRNLNRDELEEFFTAAGAAVLRENPDRAIKPVDGDYDPPAPGLQDRHCYTLWYNGQGVEFGYLHSGGWMPVAPGSYFACGEFGSEGLDPIDLMYRRYPAAWLPDHPDDSCGEWTPRSIIDSQTGPFHYMFFDTPGTLNSWVDASQEFQARAVKLMTEAFRRERRMNSFAVHLFIDAFPAGWMKTIMDCERRPKKAYFAYRDALTPLMVNLRSDRQSYFSGETLEAEAWICNDLDNPVDSTELRYWLEIDGDPIAGGSVPAEVNACRPDCQGLIQIPIPELDQRCHAILHLGLVGKSDDLLHSTELAFSMFPESDRVSSGNACILGHRSLELDEFLDDLGLVPAQLSDLLDTAVTYLVTDFEAYFSEKVRIDQAVRQGAVLLFMPLAEGKYRIGEDWIASQVCAMNPVHFVSRQTGHPIVEGFEEFDFSYWFDETLGRISPILSHSLSLSEEWLPILTTGNAGIDGRWSRTMAAVERSFGKGRIFLCQIELAGRIRTNPAARLFVERLLDYSRRNLG